MPGGTRARRKWGWRKTNAATVQATTSTQQGRPVAGNPATGAPPVGYGTVPAVVPDQVLPRVRDMCGERREPITRGEDLEVPLQHRVHRRPEEYPDHRLVNPPLLKEQAEDAMAKKVLQRVEINPRKRDEPPGCCEHAIGHQRVQIGMEVHHVPIGLNDQDNTGERCRCSRLPPGTASSRWDDKGAGISKGGGRIGVGAQRVRPSQNDCECLLAALCGSMNPVCP